LVATINGASRVLLQLVNGVLDFSKIEAGKLELEQVPFDLHALVNGICRMLRTQADAKGIRLHATILPEVPANLIGDPHHLRQVLINLAGNAIKFTDHGYVAIEVSLVAEEPAGARVRIAVRDTGIGIPADSLERVFESFAQADASTTRRFGGTGLGTTIAKQLVELMGGRIGVESVVGEGSTFWIEVPFARLPSSEDAPVAGRLVLASFGASARSALHAATAPAGWQIDDVGDIEGAVKAVASSSADAPVSCVIVYAPTAAAAQAIAPRYYAGTTRARPPLILCVEQLTAPEQSVCLAVGYASILAAPWEAHLVTNALRAALAIDAPPPLAPANPASGAPADAAIYRVLVADDAPVNLAVARAVLERAGHEVTCVESGEAAMDTAAQDARGFDVLLLDLHMPGADGLATTKFIRLLNRIEARDMPIVMLTADATPEAEQDSLAAGANTLLGKPVDPKELLRTIEKLCSARKRVGRPSGTGALPNHAEALRACAEIDREVLEQLEKLGASNGFVSRLLADYLRDTEAQMDAAQRALEAGRVDELREALHAIKGASGSVGAVGMARVCTEIRALEDQTVCESAGDIIAVLRASLAATRPALEQYQRTSV
jgi:two-component system sensor histidine kinase RpfC